MSVNPFLKSNKKKREPIKIYVSDLFVDEKGNPVPITMQIISSKEADALKDVCKVPVIDPNTCKKIGEEVDPTMIQRMLVIKSMVDPNLEDKELQESYGVNNAEDLFFEMFDMAERGILMQEFDKHFKSVEQITQDAEKQTKNA